VNFFKELLFEGAFSRGWRLSLGALACLVATFLLIETAQVEPVIAAFVAAGIEIILLVAVVSTVGRHFAVGFIATAISLGLTSGWFFVLPWGLPVIMTYEAAKPLWGAVGNVGADSRRHKAWIAAHRKEPPALAQGQILANTVNECAAAFREGDSLSGYSREPEQLQLQSQCQPLSASRADSATPARFTDRDDGWRWQYAPAAPDPSGRIAGYTVRVFEDPDLSRSSPHYFTDAGGEVRESVTGKPPVVVATPVESLALLSRCIAQIPAARAKEAQLDKAEREKLRWRRWWNPIDEVLGRCPSLRGHVALDYPATEYGVIAVSARGGNGKLVDTVGVYGVKLIPVDPKLSVFEASVTPRTSYGSHAGIRSYFIARDGSIHVKSGRGASTRDSLI
jgi:hypothetical protein